MLPCCMAIVIFWIRKKVGSFSYSITNILIISIHLCSALHRKNNFETSKEMFMHGIKNYGLVLSKKLFTHCWNETKKGTLQDENVTSIVLWIVDFSSKGYKIELFLAKNHYPLRKLLYPVNWHSVESSKIRHRFRK